jgi:hypothetical protein
MIKIYSIMLHLIVLCLFSSIAVTAGSLKGGLRLLPEVDEYNLIVKFKSSCGPDLDGDGDLILRFPPAGVPGNIMKTRNLKWTRVVKYTSQELESIRRGAAYKKSGTGFSKFNFSGMMYVDVASLDRDALLVLAKELEALDYVEYCSLEPKASAPPPEDYAPLTPDLTGGQRYMGPEPGVDCAYAWSLGVKGKGIRVSDLEHGWGDFDHEDLIDQDVGYGNVKLTDDYKNHGMAVAGIIVGGHNGYGINGCAPEATFRGYSKGNDETNALIQAVSDSRAGDIVLLEMQEKGPNGKYVPADYVKTIWDVTQVATEADIIIVGTAGNGGEDLDGQEYLEYRSRGDNGVIMVGAGSPDVKHSAMYYSTYGNDHVHVQGWGRNIFTIGYGGYYEYGEDSLQAYTSTFGGTSGAGAMVTGVVAALQSFAVLYLGTPLTPGEMRNLLVSTGTPQGPGHHIGPLPNVRAAIEKLKEDMRFAWRNFELIIAGDENGKLEPGESAQINLTWVNNTSSTAASAVVALEPENGSEPYVQIETQPVSLGAIAPAGESTSTHSFTVSSETPEGTAILLRFVFKAAGEDSLVLIKQVMVSKPETYVLYKAREATCEGKFFDQGLDSNYDNGGSEIMTFVPNLPGKGVVFEFTSFELEDEADCSYDYLEIFNGESVNAPRLGVYCGDNSPGTVYGANAAGALTFRFNSDYTQTAAGWEANISCVDLSAGTERFFPGVKPQITLRSGNGFIGVYMNNLGPGSTRLQVFGLKGEVLFSRNWEEHAITYPVRINTSKLPKGIVLLSVQNAGVTYVQKVVVP